MWRPHLDISLPYKSELMLLFVSLSCRRKKTKHNEFSLVLAYVIAIRPAPNTETDDFLRFKEYKSPKQNKP